MREFTWLQILLLVFGVLTLTCDSFVSNEVWALTTFKEAIFEDPYLVLSSWNSLDPNPCQWSGVFCSMAKDHVLQLNISVSSLKGFLAPELGLLSDLEQLILHGNNLIGTIPKEIFLLKNLQVLDLGMNQLTGPIPPEIGNLASIVKINLQSNGLTGMLPPQLGNLKHLQELHLDRNKLQGTVPGVNSTEFTSSSHGLFVSTGNAPGLCRSSQLKVADLSYNFFVGNIPRCLQHLPRSSFLGNCLQEKDLKQRSSALCGSAPPPVKSRPIEISNLRSPETGAKHPASSRPVWLLALEITTGITVGALLFIAVLVAFQRCNRKSSMIIPWKKSASDKDRYAVYIDPEMLKDVLRFSRQELEVACEDFSNIIRSSPDSVVYKGTMKGGSEIAVISFCIKEEHWTGYHELYFQREVADLARLNHGNVGKLLGYSRENCPFTRMLVFEYASNGTLYEHLHYAGGSPLSWTRRMKIIIGIARGLKYLHTELDPPFTILELSSSSVYLTEDFSPKLVDFESWKTILARSEKNSCSIASNGSICILPNSIEDRHLDIQGNIYGFGALLLEIVSGRPPSSKDVVDWARDYLEQPEVMPEIVDRQLKHYEAEDLKVICEVASLCINPNPRWRPSMDGLCSMLESRIDLSVSAELRSASLAWAELALST
ncbi:hypothetical protein Nepgr_011247 [Nepenthes gracilis]|uniref:Protein kinase domain-containing protein n=1 Tax=Nepenthes gracilis TaxID=150966 RepID=A0AAD3XM79_NEPGR|nr:hypothetical protein Nepgr_011247 [Nepenthes gracilis]